MSTVREILNEELEKLKAEIILRHEQAGQEATGKTKRSFSVENTSNNGGELWGNSYVGVLERGRKPGKIPYGFVDILKRWAQAKGISFNSDADFNRWAYFVSQKIKREGTALYRGGSGQDIFTSPVERFSSSVYDKIAVFFEQELSNQIFSK